MIQQDFMTIAIIIVSYHMEGIYDIFAIVRLVIKKIIYVDTGLC